MQDRTKEKIAAIAVAPFFVGAVILNSIWIDAKRPAIDLLKAVIGGVAMAVPAYALYYWIVGTFP